MNYTVLFNPEAGNFTGEKSAAELKNFFPHDSLAFHDITKIKDYRDFFDKLDKNTSVIIAGGDGTLNRFINEAYRYSEGHGIYYYATGSGNDFLHDIGTKREDGPVCIDKYLKNLPQVSFGGDTYTFVNGIGYGIDGYCCEVGDAMRGKTKKPVNYAAIAVKGLLFHYKPSNAKITVDGKTHYFKKVWLAPTMNGRFYGGGMIPTPAQDRLGEEGTVSTLVFYGSGKLKTLAVFPSVFKGEHIKHTEMTQVLTGHDITVEFDRPVAIQVDGETTRNIHSYSVKSAALRMASETRKNEFAAV